MSECHRSLLVLNGVGLLISAAVSGWLFTLPAIANAWFGTDKEIPPAVV